MAALDYASIPEATRQSLLSATYKFAEDLLKDPAVRAECEEWKRQRKAARQAAVERSETNERP